MGKPLSNLHTANPSFVLDFRLIPEPKRKQCSDGFGVTSKNGKDTLKKTFLDTQICF